MQKKFCHSCGTEMSSNAQFCPNCGQQATNQTNLQNPNPNLRSSKKKMSPIILVGVLIVPILFISIIFSSISESRKEMKAAHKAEIENKERAKQAIIKQFNDNRDSIITHVETLLSTHNYQEAIKQCHKYLQTNDSTIIGLNKLARTKKIEKTLKTVPASNYSKNLSLYKQLGKLNPDNDTYKAKVALYNKKIEAQKKLEQAKIEQEFRQAKSRMRIKNDDMNDTKFYFSKSSPHYVSTRSDISAYMGMGTNKNSTPYLRLQLSYVADNWLFVDSYTIKVDGIKYVINGGYAVKKDNGYGKIWEWLDKSPSEKEFEMLVKIANSKSAKIRYNGSKYYKDRAITSREKKAIKDVLTVYSHYL